MEKALADALGLQPQDLFPERYDTDGLPNRRRGRPRNSLTKHKHTHGNKPRNVKNMRAA